MKLQEQHQEEIKATRVGGFGGSDAKIFASIAKKGLENIGQTYLRRIAVAMGLQEYQAVPLTEAMAKGHEFEDRLELTYSCLPETMQPERETKLELGEYWFSPKNFKVFAHADFYLKNEKKVLEAKFIEDADTTTFEVAEKYKYQLQWYYLLGADSVTLIRGYGEEMQVEEIEIVADNVIINELIAGIVKLDKAISDGWQPTLLTDYSEEDIPEDVANSLTKINSLQREVDKLQREVDKLQKEIDTEKENIKFWMETSNAKNLVNSYISVAYVAPSVSTAFDSNKFKEEQPDLFAKYQKEQKKVGFIKIKLK